MPRYAAWLKGPGGSFAVVHASKPIKACICQAKISAYLCDYPVDVGGPVYAPPTCDAPLCDDCRVPQGEGVDYCPTHAGQVDPPRQQAHVTDARGQEYLL